VPKFKLEEFLLPWEHDGDGKKLETPKEIDVEQLRKYVYGLLTDKETLQEQVQAVTVERDNAKDLLQQAERKNETDEQRRQREAEQRDNELAELRKKNQERDKIDAIAAAFEKDGITPPQARKLAKRVSGDKESDWLADAKELVEDGFKIGTGKPANDDGGDGGDDSTDDLTSTPRATRNGQVVPPKDKGKAKSVKEELDTAIPASGW
jgi:hypothetical protein